MQLDFWYEVQIFSNSKVLSAARLFSKSKSLYLQLGVSIPRLLHSRTLHSESSGAEPYFRQLDCTLSAQVR